MTGAGPTSGMPFGMSEGQQITDAGPVPQYGGYPQATMPQGLQPAMPAQSHAMSGQPGVVQSMSMPTHAAYMAPADPVPSEALNMLMKALQCVRSGDVYQAFSLYTEALSKFGYCSLVWHAVGDLYAHENQHADSLQAYTRALGIIDARPAADLWWKLAQLYSAAQQPKDASQAYRWLLQAVSDSQSVEHSDAHAQYADYLLAPVPPLAVRVQTAQEELRYTMLQAMPGVMAEAGGMPGMAAVPASAAGPAPVADQVGAARGVPAGGSAGASSAGYTVLVKPPRCVAKHREESASSTVFEMDVVTPEHDHSSVAKVQVKSSVSQMGRHVALETSLDTLAEAVVPCDVEGDSEFARQVQGSAEKPPMLPNNAMYHLAALCMNAHLQCHQPEGAGAAQGGGAEPPRQDGLRILIGSDGHGVRQTEASVVPVAAQSAAAGPGQHGGDAVAAAAAADAAPPAQPVMPPPPPPPPAHQQQPPMPPQQMMPYQGSQPAQPFADPSMSSMAQFGGGMHNAAAHAWHQAAQMHSMPPELMRGYDAGQPGYGMMHPAMGRMPGVAMGPQSMAYPGMYPPEIMGSYPPHMYADMYSQNVMWQQQQQQQHQQAMQQAYGVGPGGPAAARFAGVKRGRAGSEAGYDPQTAVRRAVKTDPRSRKPQMAKKPAPIHTPASAANVQLSDQQLANIYTPQFAPTLRGHKGIRLVGVPSPSRASSKLRTRAIREHRLQEFERQQEVAGSPWPPAAQAVVDGVAAYMRDGRVCVRIPQRAYNQRMARLRERRMALRSNGVQVLSDDEYSSTDNELD